MRYLSPFDGSFFFDLQRLKVGDKVIQFGSVTVDNFQGLQNIAAIVQHSVGVGT